MKQPAGTRTAGLTLFVAGVVTTVLVIPYLGLNIDDSRLDVDGTVHYGVLVVHIFTAAVALVLGPLQFMAGIRARRRVHRTIGRLYLVAGVLPSALTAVAVAAWSGNPLTQVGLTSAAVLWLLTGALAMRAVRRRDFAGHRDWMSRNYALTFLAVTSRLLVPLLLLARWPFTGTGPAGFAEQVPTMIPVGQTLGWILNLTEVEIFIRRR